MRRCELFPHRSSRIPRAAGLVVAALATFWIVPGCGDDGPGDTEATVAVSGNHGAQTGDSISLSASTEGGEDTSYTWASSDESVATVDSSGTVTAVGPGEATITVTGDDTGLIGTHVIVVGEPGTPAVSIEGDHSLLVGEATTLTASTVNGTDSGYTWSSSDELVATVDGSGNVTGFNAGEVTITATGDDTGASGSIGLTVTYTIPNFDDWLASGHADKQAEAFNHWNEDDPAEIPTTCARCHSTPGFRDYIGDDGTAAFSVESAAEVGTVIECEACHNDTASMLSEVEFPSGVLVDGLGSEARCMTCHQGRESSDSVEQAITDAAPADDDTVSSDLSFTNIHYFPAGATLNGSRVRGGYEYAGMQYDWRFRHVEERDTCTECHDPHSLEVKVDACAECHTGVASVEDAKDIRMMSSVTVDYDGDGDVAEGVHGEIETLQALVLDQIQAYAADQGLDAICYSSANYPYFFIDTDGDGSCNDTEASYSNQYASWTARLVRAAYNYQFSQKDTGAFAHNAKYMIQLLYDSAMDLNAGMTSPTDLSALNRNDPGHFDGADEPARHWDEDGVNGEVSASCSKCHGGKEGYEFYLEHGVGQVLDEPGNGLQCGTCHENFGTTFDLRTVADVTFPSDVTMDTTFADSTTDVNNVCSTCHSGRESGFDVDDAIAAGDFGFLNVHYLPAGATRQGAAAGVGYEYAGKTYAGAFDSHGGGVDCSDCHDPVVTEHTFDVATYWADLGCSGCHSAATSPDTIRGAFGGGDATDYDGDGNTNEGMHDELLTLEELLLEEIVAYAAMSGNEICYDGDSYPYFFNDNNVVDGVCDETEASYSNQYGAWDAALMKAAFNFQYAHKETGAYAHNFAYMGQLLYDSIEALGGDVTGLTRP